MIWFVFAAVGAVVGLLVVAAAMFGGIGSLGTADHFGATSGASKRTPNDQQRKAMLIVGKTAEQVERERWTFAAVFLLGGVLLTALAGIGLVPLPPTLWLILAVGFGVFGWFLPGMSLNSEAAKQKKEFGHAFGGYLTFVALLLAGGHNIDSALATAARMGGGRHFAAIRRAADDTEAAGLPAYQLFGRLAELYDITTVTEMASAVRLAVQQGTGLADAVGVRAEATRRVQRLEVRRAAERASTAMQLPALVFVFAPMGFVMVGVMRNLYAALSGDVTGVP